MRAAHNTVVKLTYELRTQPDGDVFDSADAENPLSFLFGHKNLLDGFEKNIEGLEAGSKFKFEIQPNEGYGEYNLNNLVQLDKKMFEGAGVPLDDVLFVGNIIPLQDQSGNHFEGRISGITETHVVVDMNHPLAGKTLYFSGEIIAVRSAHPAEIEHGHAHEGGHHH